MLLLKIPETSKINPIVFTGSEIRLILASLVGKKNSLNYEYHQYQVVECMCEG